MQDNGRVKLTVLMPCRDEEKSVGACVDEARAFLENTGIIGEVIVVDNCSKDSSAAVAKEHGARLVREKRIGYGYAIRCGLKVAKGEYIIIADCDMTYELSDMERILGLLEEGYDLVVGDRFSGRIEKGAMSPVHRAGGMALSAIARMRFHVKVNDFHCGIRGIRSGSLNKMKFRTGGMEFATEMIALASKGGLRITQTPVTLKKSTADRHSKLRVIRDGIRHITYIILMRPHNNRDR